MKKVEDIPVEDLQRVAKQLVEGLWGDDASIERIPLKSPSEPKVESTADRALIALQSIHRERIRRLGEHQMKHLEMDVVLMGVSSTEKAQVHAAISISVIDYMRPLGDLFGVWEEDDMASGDDQPEEKEVNIALASEEEEKKTETSE